MGIGWRRRCLRIRGRVAGGGITASLGRLVRALLLHFEQGRDCLLVPGVLRHADRARLTAIVTFLMPRAQEPATHSPRPRPASHTPRPATAL